MENVNSVGMSHLLLSLALLAGSAPSQMQETPQIEPKRQTKNAVPPQQSSTDDFNSSVTTTANTRNVETGIHTNNTGNEGTEFWPSLFGYRLKVTDTLVAVFTALLFLATILLYRATREVVKRAEDTAMKQLRAYVNVSSARISNVANVKQIELKSRNYGRTPATKIIVRYDFSVGKLNWESAITLEPTMYARKIEHGVMGPTAPMNLQVALPPLLAGVGAHMEEMGNAFYFWGDIKYEDAFGEPQTTWFRCMIRGKDWLSGGKMGICAQGNDAT